MKLLKYFLFIILFSCGKSDKSIKIKGSDTEVNLAVQLAEEFHKVDPEFNVSISGGGSGLGIASLLNGQADIANSSRALNEYEEFLFRKRKIEIDTFIFAEDAIAFVVAKDCPLDSISTDELAKILNGTYTNWSSLTKQNLPVNIYGRQSNSGTHAFIKKKLNIEFSPKAKEMNGNAQIIEAIKTDHSGIGYVGAGYIMHEASDGRQVIKVLKIAASKAEPSISPLDEQAITSKKYFFQRPLYQFIRKETAGKTSSFIAFEKSSKGVSIIKTSGYYSVPQKENNAAFNPDKD